MLGQYFGVTATVGLAYMVPFKMFFIYLLFKFAHQHEATRLDKKEQETIIKKASDEV